MGDEVFSALGFCALRVGWAADLLGRPVLPRGHCVQREGRHPGSRPGTAALTRGTQGKSLHLRASVSCSVNWGSSSTPPRAAVLAT